MRVAPEAQGYIPEAYVLAVLAAPAGGRAVMALPEGLVPVTAPAVEEDTAAVVAAVAIPLEVLVAPEAVAEPVELQGQ
jgi:dihydrodipicolinate synthase/N-acetylneuraminate lyase